MAHQSYSNNRRNNKRDSQEKGSNAEAAPASLIDEPFHNPYTFIPFPKDIARNDPTPLSADEHPDERHRRSGVLEIEVQTLSPLLTSRSKPEKPLDKKQKGNKHNVYRALTIGDDVIIPATGVRGALRSLMTILAGGTLDYINEDLWLLEARVSLDEAKEKPKSNEAPLFLAQVIKAGSSRQSGLIQLGGTELVPVDKLEQQLGNLKYLRPTPRRRQSKHIYKDNHGEWFVKLSGFIKCKGVKKEGLFKPNGKKINIPKEFWHDYQNRHRQSTAKQLRKGDLIWLEPNDPYCRKIESAADIKSLQWTRWTRQGQKLLDRLPEPVRPDYLNKDGKVDMVTDMFGQVHKTLQRSTFAGRVRPGNLVFHEGLKHLRQEVIAPLSSPHPGCVAFYCDDADLDTISAKSPLKGYKVYRNTLEHGDQAPWKYSVQGVYKERGDLKMPPQQNVNITAELLNKGLTGKLKISFRALHQDELALLLSAFTVDWKLGGGKPLGLGHCRVTAVALIDEDGNRTNPLGPSMDTHSNLKLLSSEATSVEHLKERIDLYRASQVPVSKLRYPRAVTQTKNQSRRAGLAWYTRHASQRKTALGLQTIWTKGELKIQAHGNSQITAQALPPLDINDPQKDLLYGYDMIDLVDQTDGKRLVSRLAPFDPNKHARDDEKAGENISQSRETRKIQRDQRVAAPLLDAKTIAKRVDKFLADSTRNQTVVQSLLDEIVALDITPDQSNKWEKRITALNEIVGES